MMNWKKICAFTLCGALTLSLAGCGQTEKTASSADVTSKKLEKTLEEKANVKSGSGNLQKEETVYLMADAKGTVDETIVSAWLKNQDRTEKLEDSSELTDIKNVKGDETFTQTSNNVTWDAQGADIYYQGNTKKEAPVAVDVTYYLDGKEMSAKDIAGKSGKVKIRFDYKNHEKNGDVYTPFMMVTGMILDGDKFTGIEVDHGKIISDGSNQVVVGYGLPGLKSSLDLTLGDKTLDLDIPESFEVTADVEDFSLDMTMTLATTEIFNDIDTDELDLSELFEKLDDKLDEFTDGSNELSDGIKEYTKGVSSLADGTKTLKNGTKTLYANTKKIKTATASVKSGSATLDTGAQTLKTGIATAKSGSAQLKTGYEGDKGAVAGAKALATGLATLNQAVTALSLPTAKVPEVSQEQMQQIQAVITATLQKEIPAAIQEYAKKDPTIATDQHVQAAYQAAYQTAYAKAYQEGMKAGAQAAVDQINATVSGMSGQITTLQSSVAQLATGSSQLATGVDKLYEGTKTLDSGLSQLKSGSETLAGGTATLKSGSSQLDTGAGKLNKGVKTLNAGAIKLDKGANKLDNASDALLDGTKELLQGVDKIVNKANVYEADATDITDRAKELVEAGKSYHSFSGIKENATGSCKFIIKTAKVEK